MQNLTYGVNKNMIMKGHYEKSKHTVPAAGDDGCTHNLQQQRQGSPGSGHENNPQIHESFAY